MAARRHGAGGQRARSGALGRALLRRPGGFPLSAGGPRPGRLRHRPRRHAVQLLRDGHDPRQHGGHLRAPARSGADPAAGRRHRLRLLDLAAQGGAGARRRCRRLGTVELHGRVGLDVPHDHERGFAPRRDDGHAALRPSRREDFVEAKRESTRLRNFNLSRAGDRRLHEGDRRQRRLAVALRRPRLPDAQGARCGIASCARPTMSPSPA